MKRIINNWDSIIPLQDSKTEILKLRLSVHFCDTKNKNNSWLVSHCCCRPVMSRSKHIALSAGNCMEVKIGFTFVPDWRKMWREILQPSIALQCREFSFFSITVIICILHAVASVCAKEKSNAKKNALTCFRRCRHSPRDLSQIQSTLSRLTLSRCSAVHATAVTDFTWPRRCCRHSPLITSQTRTPPLAAPLTTWRLLVWNDDGKTETFPRKLPAYDFCNYCTWFTDQNGPHSGKH